MTRDNSDNYREILLSGAPLLDVRAPVEFSKGAFPNAVNLPLLNDGERQKVGTCYKQRGQEAAIALGHQLVCGDIKAERIRGWREFASTHPEGYLYCFRGGLRSQLSQQWLEREGGIAYPRIIGGYKAMRGFLLDTLDDVAVRAELVVVGGLTGTGKTEVLAQLGNAIDLEGHANHRGSSFGKHATPQPAQIDFENRLAIDFLTKSALGMASFVVEDESRAIGRCALPLALYAAMSAAPIVWLEDSLAGRVERILQDYVVDLREEFAALHGEEQGFVAFAHRLRESLDNILKRLGGERHRRLAAIMDSALDEQLRSGVVDGHRDWIAGLLTQYYDPMYAFQRQAKAGRIVYSGGREDVIGYLRQRCG